MKRPSNIQKFKPVDPKLGIKSSLPKSKSTIALVILLWLSNDKKYEIEYSETDGDKITISENCYDKLIQYLRNNIDIKGDSEEDIMNYVNENQLFHSQLESLIVALELVWRIASIKFKDSNKADSAERTGKKRFEKILSYTNNIDLFDTFHSYIETSGFYTPQEICAVQTAKETNDIINIGEQENNVQVYKLITTCLSAHDEDTEMSFYLPSGIARKITGITYGDGYEYINENNEVIYKFSDVDKDWKNQQVCLQVNTSILESALKENSYKLFWVFRVYRSPSNKAYELYGNQICHDTDRSFVVWFDEEECKYIELKEIKPIRPNPYDDYELNIKILYGDAED